MNSGENIPQSDRTVSQASAGRSDFNTTHWSVVLLAGQEGPPEAAEALEKLCGAYWYPLYAYARRRGHNPEDGQDLTQQFFAGFLENKYFGLADPERGRFRSFLLASFKHFLANEYNRSQTAKRGGHYTFVSWDEAQAEAHYRKEPASEVTPDTLYEHAWALTLLEKVMRNLQREYMAQGKPRVFDTLEVFLSGEKTDATYAEIGPRLQMSESAIKMAVLRMRRRYGELLRAEIAHTLNTPTQVDEELRHLLSAVSR